ncbi:MAG: hypothetical protein IPL59_25665 [Candidatus Competibacteraceae bacterium]|nr:hypothetical protein [Candidatus Competibacteraceae bacterium]
MGLRLTHSLEGHSMNLNKWMRLGGILAVLLGVTPMLAVAQAYNHHRTEDRSTIRVDDNRHQYQRNHYNNGSRSYNHRYYQRQYHRGGHHYYRRHYSEHNYQYNYHHRKGYQNK